MDAKTRQAMRLWTLAQPVVSAFVTSVVRDFSARDDVLQEIAVAVIESIDRYDPEQPFVAWALGIAQNQVRLYLRRVRRDRHVFDEATVSCLAFAFDAAWAGQSQRLDFLQDCLRELVGRPKEILELRYRHDLKPAAIAESLGMTANTVAKALQRVRDQLRDCIERKSAREERAV